MKLWKWGALAALLTGHLYAAPLPVVASFSILGDVAHQIGGNRISVQTLVGPDENAHVHQLSSNDIRKIRAARLVLFNGLGFEKADAARAVQQSKVPLAYATAGISAAKMSGGQGHQASDPHVWHDPVLMQTYARNVANALIKVDPAGRAYYQQRLSGYAAQLKALNTYASQSFAAIPAAKRKVLTGHDAFGYLGRRYHVQFIAPQSANAEAEPSARDVAAIIRQIKQQGINAIFTENIKNPRMVERIARETGRRVQGRLYSDALSKGAPAGTYADMFRYNVRVLSQAMRAK